jgi:predicted CXXCH cytochrome family protein
LCHEDTRPPNQHPQNQECAACHNDPGGNWLGGIGCTSCHDQPQGSRRQIVGPGGDFDQDSKHISGTISNSDCARCHNISQHQQGIVILADPDTGGAWGGTETEFCLTCHDNAPPAGVNFPSSSGTGYDKSAFAGTTHAVNLGSDSCIQCHESHGSPYVSLLKDKYIKTDYNQWSYGDGDYALCWNCHDESDTVLGDNKFEDRHDKHVNGANSTCYSCHDAHAGYDSGEPGLISFKAPMQQGFDMSWQDGSNNSTIFWITSNEGNCLMNCHDKKHGPKDYNR